MTVRMTKTAYELVLEWDRGARVTSTEAFLHGVLTEAAIAQRAATIDAFVSALSDSLGMADCTTIRPVLEAVGLARQVLVVPELGVQPERTEAADG